MPATASPDFFKEHAPAVVPIWREAFAGLDWVALHASPVYYGLGVPRGDGSAVILVPGFMGTDYYMVEMHLWLCRMGYEPYFSRIGWNAECLDMLVDRLMMTVEKAQAETGKKVHLIGHSLGGVLARSGATRDPDRIASVITLGSPFRGIRSHPFVLETANIIRRKILREKDLSARSPCFTGYCECEAVSDLQDEFPPSVPQTAIYTKSDGIVAWEVCLNGDNEHDVEVHSTHIGMVFNPQVYRTIALRLGKAQQPEASPEVPTVETPLA